MELKKKQQAEEIQKIVENKAGPQEENKGSSDHFSEVATERPEEEEKKQIQVKPRVSSINITGKIRDRVKSAKKDQAAKRMKAEMKKKNMAEEKRKKDLENLETNNRYIGKNLVMPIYKYDERLKIYREEFVPPDT